MSFVVSVVDYTNADFPASLRTHDETPVFPRLWALGNLAILERRLLGFFCSTRCPGEVILQTYDLVRTLRDARVTVIGGFHSPMEKECLSLLLRGTQPVVICPARSLERMRLPAAWQTALMEGRLLILSPFAGKQRRMTIDLARRRNEFVAALADEIFVAYVSPGSKTEQFCRDLFRRGKSVWTVESSENSTLLSLGAVPLRSDAAILSSS